jgi:hypothetical protein
MNVVSDGPDPTERLDRAATRASREDIEGVPTLVHVGETVYGSRSTAEHRAPTEGA